MRSPAAGAAMWNLCGVWPGRCTLTVCTTPGWTGTSAWRPSGSDVPSTEMIASLSSEMSSVASVDGGASSARCGGVRSVVGCCGGDGGGGCGDDDDGHSKIASVTPAAIAAATEITTMRRTRDGGGSYASCFAVDPASAGRGCVA